MSCHNGVWRVQGSLAISRAIGDIHLKDWIISEPETTKLELTPDCEFLMIASDGLWEKVFVARTSSPFPPTSSCKTLIDGSMIHRFPSRKLQRSSLSTGARRRAAEASSPCPPAEVAETTSPSWSSIYGDLRGVGRLCSREARNRLSPVGRERERETRSELHAYRGA